MTREENIKSFEKCMGRIGEKRFEVLLVDLEKMQVCNTRDEKNIKNGQPFSVFSVEQIMSLKEYKIYEQTIREIILPALKK